MAHKDAETIKIFMEYVRNLPPENFIRSILLCLAAPTIKGLKAGVLINFRRHNHENMRSLWLEHADEWLMPMNLQWLLLNEQGNNALVMIYRKELLARALCCDDACGILAENGYPLHDVDACLECLRKKFCKGFPHEIGLFLDYPPEDVRGFIEKRKAKKLSCPCYWKVYGNVHEAIKKFRQYKNAECEAAREILAGELINWRQYYG